jgi:PAS domain S-box-containing protein
MTTRDAGRVRGDLVAMVAELRSHQIELELQNEQLRDVQRELETARDAYAQLFDLAPIPYVTFDRDCAIVAANLACARLLATDRLELAGGRLAAFVAPDDVARFHRFVDETFAAGDAHSVEVMLLRRVGPALPVRIEAAASPEPDGKPIARAAVVDLSEIRAAQAMLAESQQRLRDVFEQSGGGIVVVAPSGELLDANAAFCRWLGYDASELQRRTILELTHPLDRDAAFRMLRAARTSADATIDAEKRFVTRTGEIVWGHETTSWVVGERGVPIYAVGVILDITARRRAEARVAVSERRVREIAERIEDVFYTADADTQCLVYASPAFERIWGWPVSEVANTPRAWQQVIHPDDRARVEQSYVNLLHGDPFDEEYRIVRPDESVRWIRDRAYPVEDDDGHVRRITGVAEDITEHRELEAQLHHAQKLEAVGTLASGVAHDFNNLLMGIAGCAAIALDTVPESSPARPYLREIRAAATSGATITRQLTSFARKRDENPQVLELDRVIAQRESLLRRLLGEDVALEVTLGAGAASVRCDEGQIEQILMNLAANARDAMPRGGELRIETRRVDVEATRRPGALRAGRYVSIEVTDSGVGMSDAVRGRAFEPFFTTKPAGKGSGLGLSSVYGIARRAGGTIEVRSREGAGTTVEVLLPRVRASGVHPIPLEDVALAPASSQGTVLLIEDEPMVRRAARHYLQQAGYQVLEAGDGEAALDVCRSHCGPIDLVVTDMVLPGAGGTEVAHEVLRMRPDVAVVYMSAHASEWLEQSDRIEPGATVLQKPFDRATLLDRVSRVRGDRPG